MKFLSIFLALMVTVSTYAFLGFENGTDIGLYSKINCGTTVTCSKNAKNQFNIDVSGSFVGGVFSGNISAVNGAFSGNVSGVNGTFTGDVTGDGGDQLVGFLQNQVTATATTITAAQCGSTFINAGAIEIELPEASTVVGCRLTFVTANAANFDIDPDAADQILVQTNAAGDMIRNATLGNSITIQAINATQWAPISVSGTWADAN